MTSGLYQVKDPATVERLTAILDLLRNWPDKKGVPSTELYSRFDIKPRALSGVLRSARALKQIHAVRVANVMHWRYGSPDAKREGALIRRVEAFVVETPGCTGTDIARAMGVPVTTISVQTSRLRASGSIRPMAKTPGNPRTRWEEGMDSDVEARLSSLGRPSQATVSTWTPHHSRDPLVAFLFGASK